MKNRELTSTRSTQAEIFRFFASAIKGNQNRIKLGSMIQGASRKMTQYATDNFTLLFYDTLLELVKVIFVKPKFLEKIDKNFFYSVGDEFGYEDYPAIKAYSERFFQPANVGTITKFFFYTMETLHKHFIPFTVELMEFHKRFRRIESVLKKTPPNHPKSKNMVI